MSEGFEKRMNDYSYTDNPTFEQTAVIALDIAAAIKEGRYEWTASDLQAVRDSYSQEATGPAPLPPGEAAKDILKSIMYETLPPKLADRLRAAAEEHGVREALDSVERSDTRRQLAPVTPAPGEHTPTPESAGEPDGMPASAKTSS